MIRRLSTPQLVVDISIAAFCFLLRLALGADGPAIVVVVILMAGSLAIRRLSPGIAIGVLWIGVLVQLTAGLPPDLANSAIPAVLYATGRYGIPAVRWVGLGSAVIGAFVATTYSVLPSGIAALASLVYNGELPNYLVIFAVGFTASLALFVVSWTLGMLVRAWATARASRAAAVTAAEQQRAAEREVAVEQERTRIARDMHDVVAHSLAVVIAQADGARYMMAQDPDAADAALTTISTTAREALADVRVLLGQLRHSQETGPQPALADLDRLLAQLRSSGLAVRRETVGDARPVPTGQQLAAYRIVQESLTNALRHGRTGAEALVRFTWTDEAVRILVANPFDASVPVAGDRAGHGIDGMRERAILVGGVLEARADDGTFTVTATLPLAWAAVSR
jgi:signal transduction histidine kinase